MFNSPLVKTIGVFISAIFFFNSQLFSCGFAYVSSCNTFATIEINNVPTTYFYGACGWRTQFDNRNLGSNLTDLNLTWGESTTWESCDNNIMDSKIYYRVYLDGNPSGDFQVLDLDQLTQTGSVYRTKRRSATPNIDLLANLQSFSNYTLEMYFESIVDTDLDNVSDALLQQNNNGANFKATFSTGAITTSSFTLSLINQQNVSCNATDDGSVEVEVTGGIAPFSYAWSNGDTTAAISNLTAGNYSVTVTDANNDTGFANATIAGSASLNVQTSAMNAGCMQMNGSISASTLNGTAPFVYEWSNGLIGTMISGLGVGNYTVTVTDTTGCSGMSTATIEAPCGTGIYCDSESAFPWVDWISDVQFGTINNSSNKQVYADYTDQSTTVSTGGSYTMTLTNSYSWATYDEYWNVWIDFNQNELFESNEAVVSQLVPAPPNGSGSSTTPFTIIIPTDALAGSTRMRVSLKRDAEAEPCETIPNGEVEDYTIIVEGGSGGCNIFAEATALSCDDNGTASDPADDLWSFDLTVTGTGNNWTSTIDGNAISGTHGTIESFDDLLISDGSLNFSIMDADSSDCSFNISVNPPAPCSNGGTAPGSYCDSSSDFPWHDWISGVDFGGIAKTSNKQPYADFTDETGFAQAGSTDNPITLTAGFSWFTYEETWRVWIDYNRDGIFQEPGEIAFSGTNPAPPAGTLDHPMTGNIEVPPTAVAGKTRMRVSMKRGSEPAEPCDNDIPNGEVEDYSVIIQSAAANIAGRSTEALDFFVENSAGGVQLRWMSTSYEKNDRYLIEKSTDGKHFEPVYVVGAQTTPEFKYFNWTDNSLTEKTSFYRLKLIYWTGASVTTHPKKVENSSSKTVRISPNPAEYETSLDLRKFEGQSLQISIANQLGKVVELINISEAGVEPLRLDISNYLDGIYFIFIKPENQKAVTARLVVQGF